MFFWVGYRLLVQVCASYPEGMNIDAFYNTQKEIRESDEQPSQEQQSAITFDPAIINVFNPVNIEASQTNLLTRVADYLVMNPKEGMEVEAPTAEATTENNEFDDRTNSLTNTFVTAEDLNADAATAKSNPSHHPVRRGVITTKGKTHSGTTSLVPNSRLRGTVVQ